MKLITLVVAALGLSLSHASAQSIEPEAPHQGVLVRVTPGVAAATSRHDGETMTIRGPSGRLGLAVGYAVLPRLILSGELVVHSQSGARTATFEEAVWRAYYLGLGATWYTSGNTYVVASAGTVVRSLAIEGMTETTDAGFGVKLGVGKEWWTSRELGLGVAFELMLGNVTDRDSVAAFGLSFSATYN